MDNVYLDPVKRVVRDDIYFPAEIRKGKRKALSIPVSDKLKSYLERYQPPTSGYLFPSPRDPQKPISYEAVYKYLKKQVVKAGLSQYKIGTHSGRRSLVTNLYEQGVSLETIRGITGHATLTNLQPYVEKNPEIIKQALNNSSLWSCNWCYRIVRD